MQDPSNSHAAGEPTYACVKDATAGRGFRGDAEPISMLQHLQRLGGSKDVCPLRASVRTLNDQGARLSSKIAEQVSHRMWPKDGSFHQLSESKKK